MMEDWTGTADRCPRVVEFIGLAGSGKSTLTTALLKNTNGTVAVVPPYFREMRDIPFFVVNAIRALPFLVSVILKNRLDRYPTAREVAWIVILTGWHRRLKAQASRTDKVLVLDQGPVFMLAMLYLYGPKVLQRSTAARWWASMARKWGGTIHLLICLEASERTLVARIRRREVWHGVKDRSDLEACEYLSRYRTAYAHVLSLLNGDGARVEVMSVNTERHSIKETMELLSQRLALKEAMKGL